MFKFIENLSIKAKIISGFLAVSACVIFFSFASYIFIGKATQKKDTILSDGILNHSLLDLKYVISQEIMNLHKISNVDKKSMLDSLLIKNEMNFKIFESDYAACIENIKKNIGHLESEQVKNSFIKNLKLINSIHIDYLIPATKTVHYLRTEYISATEKDENSSAIINGFNSKFQQTIVPVEKNLNVALNLLTEMEEQVNTSLEQMDLKLVTYANIAKYLYLILVAFGILLVFITFPAAKYFISPFYKLKDYIILLGKGHLPEEKIGVTTHDEIGELALTLEHLTDGLKSKAAFAHVIQQSDFNHDFKLLSKNDVLGNSLLEMSYSLNKAAETEKIRQVEESQRSWATHGLAKFAEIMRKGRDNAEELSDEIIKELVKYMNANQGGLFLYNDNNKENITLDLVACYAYDRKKYAEKIIRIKEGLIGTCAIEKETIYMTNIPDDYIEITSGLGDANPKSLILIPLKLEDTIFGVVEIASFNELQQHEIHFLEKIAESIASTLSSVKINLKTQELLKHSQEQSAQLTEQEEELRQNLEEMQATQDEMLRKEAEMTGLMNIMNKSAIVSKTDLRGIITYANDEFCRTSQYGRSELIGKNHNIVRHPDMPKEAFADLWQTISRGDVWRGQVKNKSKDGTAYWVDATIAPIMGEDGIPYEYVAVRYLITEFKELLVDAQQKTEELKGQQEEMLQNIEEMSVIKEELEKKDIIQKEEIGALNKQNQDKLEELKRIEELQKNKIKKLNAENDNRMEELKTIQEKCLKAETDTKLLYENEINSMFHLWYNHLNEIEKVYLNNTKKS